MSANRAKCGAFILLGLLILGVVVWQISNDSVFVGKGSASREVSARDGWVMLTFQSIVALGGLAVLIYWFVKDYWPDGSNQDSDGSGDPF